MLIQNVCELPELTEMIAGGYVVRREHPTEPLAIYNYTAKAQYEPMWNETTLTCRGLIADAGGNVVARPFRKFFNLEQVERLPEEPFEVYEKVDGSLGVLYWVNGEAWIASRGSFDSEQARMANKMLRNYDTSALRPDYTYLFEIVFKENRIVVNYGNERALILLAVVHTQTGVELVELPNIGFPRARKYGPYVSLSEFADKHLPQGFARDDAGKCIRDQAGVAQLQSVSPHCVQGVSGTQEHGTRGRSEEEYSRLGKSEPGTCTPTPQGQIPTVPHNLNTVQERSVHGLPRNVSILRDGLSPSRSVNQEVCDRTEDRQSQLESDTGRSGKVRRFVCELPPHSHMEREVRSVIPLDSVEEGFVLRYASGLRVKVKLAEYVRLHRILTGITEKRLLEDYLMAGVPIDSLIEHVPDEFYRWVQETVGRLRGEYQTIEAQAKQQFAAVVAASRKEYAEAFAPSPLRAVLFRMLDSRDYSQLIWKMLKADVTPFKTDEV